MLLQAQMIMYLDCVKLSGSTPVIGPTVSNQAVEEPEAQ